jgi:pilus assembly protein CpaE
MARILIIDDEPIYHKVISHALKTMKIDAILAKDSLEGLKAASNSLPDLVICGVMMPIMSGYDITRSLRRDPRFSRTPILILTAQSGLEEKLAAFEAGADATMTKPFTQADFIEQVNILLHKTEDAKKLITQSHTNMAYLIGVHSLRGGMGCSSIAVNLSLGLIGLWSCPTLLVDMALSAGQVALMLNAPLKRTWADIADCVPGKLDFQTLGTIIGEHESGLNFIAAPHYPPQAKLVTDEHIKSSFNLMRSQFEYIITDLPHDFSDKTIQILDAADVILLVIAPELTSVQTALTTLDTYSKMGYGQDKIKIALNWRFEKKGLSRKQIESVIHRPIDLVLPYVPDVFIEAINFGKPFLHNKPYEMVSALVEDFTLKISKPEHRVSVPSSPTQAWLRAYQRKVGSKIVQ